MAFLGTFGWSGHYDRQQPIPCEGASEDVMNDKTRKNPDDDAAGAWLGCPDPNSEIGMKLKALYSSVQEEPIPERFLDLLDKLDESERTSDRQSRHA
jgi:hypothetical protein